MSEYIIDEKGKWLVKGSCKILPVSNMSEEYKKQEELEQKLKEEQELLDSLIPSDKEVLMAEVEIQTITILGECGLV